MKKVILIAATAMFSLLLMQGCKKNGSLVNNDNPSGKKSGLKTSWANGDPMINGTFRIYKDDPSTGVVGAVSVVGNSTADGAKMHWWQYKATNGQKWSVTKITTIGTEDFYKIINVGSGKALEVVSNPGVSGEQLQQNPYTGSDKQLWVIKGYIYGFYSLKNKATGMFLRRDGNLFADGTKITQSLAITPADGSEYFYFDLVAYKDPVVTAFFQRTTGPVAMDGAYSFLLPTGKVLWNYGDTYYDQYSGGTVPCQFNVRSSSMLQPNATNWDWTQTLGKVGAGTTTLYYSGGDLWPSSGFIGNNDTLYVFCAGPGAGGLPHVWAKILASSIPATGSTLTIQSYKTLQTFGTYYFGTSFTKEADGFVYAYGFKRPNPFAADIYVARFPASNPNVPWTFYKGGTYTNAANWSTDTLQAISIGSGPTNNTISKVNGKYVLTSTDFSYGCSTTAGNIYMSTSNSVVGPFSTAKLIYTLDDVKSGVYPFYYGAKAHPESINSNNELLITYTINGYGGGTGCLTDCVSGRKDPNVYRPRGVRVPLKLIDPTY